MNKEIIIALCAGEASGDLLGAHLIEALKQQYSRIRFIGIGGPRMKAAGLISSFEQEPLAVRGYVEILGNLREILKIRKGFVEQLKKTSPHVFIGIDSPDFNLPIAAKLKAVGIPTLHYVSPSIWAWKPERVHKIVKQVNKVLCLFPMEPKLYRDAGGCAEYVGHPLAQMLPLENSREAVRERLKLGLTTPVFALLPGSRVSEVEYMAPVFLRAAALIVQALPEAVFLMPYPSAIIREHLQNYLKLDEFRHLPIRLQAAKTELACMAADVVLVTSGTAALEVALCKRPMVISYRVSRFTYALVRRKIKIPYVGLPNILLGKKVVPELLQNEATPEKLAHAVLDWYYHPARVAELEKQFLQLHQRLRRNTNELAAYAVLSEVGVQLSRPDGFGEEAESGVSEHQEEHQETVETPEPMAMPTPMVVAAHSSSSHLPSACAPKLHQVRESMPARVAAAPAPVQTAKSIESEMQSSESDMNKSHSKRPTSRKSSGGLFGWLMSLFKKKSVPEPIATKTVKDKKGKDVVIPVASESNLVAVSRVEEENRARVGQKTQQPEKPIRHVIEEEELQPAKVQMNLPKSTILSQNGKPNIFTKYMTEEQQSATSSESGYQAAQPNVSVANMVQPAARTVSDAAVSSQQQQPASAAPVVPPETATRASSATPAPGSLAKYITQASMAWLPDNLVNAPKVESVKPASSSHDEEETVSIVTEPTVNAKPVEQQDSIDITDLFGTMESIESTAARDGGHQVQAATDVSLPAVETTEIVFTDDNVVLTVDEQLAPSSPPIITDNVAMTPVAETTTEVVIEDLNLVSEPAVQAAVETKAPVIEASKVVLTSVAPVIEPVVHQHVKVIAMDMQPKETVVAEEVAVPSVVPEIVEAAEIVIAPPSQKAEEWANTSFASVFRKHTVQNEQADNIDAASDAIEAEETSEEPEQIVFNSTVALSSAPTQADAVPLEEGTPAPEVAKYSTNPKRYHGGIFY